MNIVIFLFKNILGMKIVLLNSFLKNTSFFKVDITKLSQNKKLFNFKRTHLKIVIVKAFKITKDQIVLIEEPKNKMD